MFRGNVKRYQLSNKIMFLRDLHLLITLEGKKRHGIGANLRVHV